MNRLRVIGLFVLSALLVWFVVRFFVTEPPPPAPVEAVREAFHPTRPLRVEVVQAPDADDADAPRWMLRELRHLLAHGKMKVAPEYTADINPTPFALRIALNTDGTQAAIELVAPDAIVDKRVEIELPQDSKLALMRQFAAQLPAFLGTPTGSADWSAALGTEDAAAYEAYLTSSDALFAAQATGFTAPPPATRAANQQIEKLETLLRTHRDFARARALLSLAYLSVGGKDEPALTKLAASAAERALTLDAELADAQAALGIVHLRRMGWTAAREQFDAALARDSSSLAALEGLGCLHMDTGHARDALTVTARALALQPGNRGARQCATYALVAANTPTPADSAVTTETARIHAAMHLLAGETAAAETLLRSHGAVQDELIRRVADASGAGGNPAAALRIVTRTADEGHIDIDTEILFGAALRRPDFVFNRILRLAKQNEAVPLRVLWLPQTAFLREHNRFREIVSTVNLSSYWQDHGVPDVCATEPTRYGCTFKSN